MHEPELLHSAAVIKGKHHDLRPIALVERVTAAKHQAATGGTGSAGGHLDWGSISTPPPDRLQTFLRKRVCQTNGGEGYAIGDKREQGRR